MSRPLIVSALVLGPLLLAACSSTPTTATAPVAPTPATGAQGSRPAATPATGATSSVAPQTVPATRSDANASAGADRSVYFSFDEAAISGQWMPVVERQGQQLSRSAAVKVRVEGHCDERGGTEYNLALGQRRADAVKKALQIYGVKPAQIEAVSFGKEKPKALGHDEQAWAQNRRADIVAAAGK
ncbi:peptidoglycan-associated lipoprotein Pal [Aquabacterium sp.]|uniref:peptidoglycan-associated lipoprotein Pal n=1 Tax=Aquabacterium sp. TaxID=1872578 RepID=UPI00378372AA